MWKQIYWSEDKVSSDSDMHVHYYMYQHSSWSGLHNKYGIIIMIHDYIICEIHVF